MDKPGNGGYWYSVKLRKKRNRGEGGKLQDTGKPNSTPSRPSTREYRYEKEERSRLRREKLISKRNLGQLNEANKKRKKGVSTGGMT